MSAYGGVITFNRKIDAATAKALNEQFVEVLYARGYEEEALEILSAKENLRILDDQERRLGLNLEVGTRQVQGGMLAQDRDVDPEDRFDWQVVSERRPSDEEWAALAFAWKVCKHVRSNAIVISDQWSTVGIGAGQTSRVESVRLAVTKAQTPLKGTVLASDAFFPFADGPELAIEAGVSAIIQPGGSMRDPEVVEAIDKAGIVMVFTGRRHFRH
jgi:phosphoribosylaminoimidazolecarboxamide formyltransferase/IMP cyclohydrolase